MPLLKLWVNIHILSRKLSRTSTYSISLWHTLSLSLFISIYLSDSFKDIFSQSEHSNREKFDLKRALTRHKVFFVDLKTNIANLSKLILATCVIPITFCIDWPEIQRSYGFKVAITFAYNIKTYIQFEFSHNFPIVTD